MRWLGSVTLVFLLAARGPAEDRLPNTLTAEESEEGWILVFDGQTVGARQIEGDHEIVDGALILGGTRKTRAYLHVQAYPGWQMRLQYRTQGKESAGIGWDYGSKTRTRFPGVALPILTPRESWSEFSLVEHFDALVRQRLIRHPHGANASHGPINRFWIEVPAGTRVFLRNMRLKDGHAVPWHWLLAIAFGLGGFMLLWWWRKRRRSRKAQSSGRREGEAGEAPADD